MKNIVATFFIIVPVFSFSQTWHCPELKKPRQETIDTSLLCRKWKLDSMFTVLVTDYISPFPYLSVFELMHDSTFSYKDFIKGKWDLHTKGKWRYDSVERKIILSEVYRRKKTRWEKVNIKQDEYQNEFEIVSLSREKLRIRSNQPPLPSYSVHSIY